MTMKKRARIALILSLVIFAAALPFLCTDCKINADASAAYRTRKAQQDAAGDDAQAQLMALLLGQGGAAQEAPEFPGVRFSWYGLALAEAMALGVSAVLALARKKSPGLLLGLALATPFGFIGARLFYCLYDLQYYLVSIRAPGAMLTTWEGGLCLSGAVFLAALGGAAGAKIAGEKAGNVLNAMAPGMLAFVLAARLAEIPVQAGFGPEMEFSLPLLTRMYADVPRLNTSLLMALTALAILACTRKCEKSFAASAFLYGGTLILLESLRRDGHMLWGFVHAEMVCALLMALPAMLYMARGKKRKILAVLSAALLAGVVTALEFALDRANLPDLLLYAAYALVIGGWLYLGFRLGQEPLRSNNAV